MEKQKFASLALVFMLVLTSVPFALAEVSDSELEDEIEIMGISERAEYRVRQLVISLESQIEYAEDILVELDVSDEVMSDLEDSVIKFEALLDRANGIDLTSSADVLAAEFLAIKEEASEISSEFRSTVHDAVVSSELENLKASIKEMKDMRRDVARLEIAEIREAFELERAERLFDELGIEVAEGSTPEETRALIKEALSELSSDERNEFRAELKADREAARDDVAALKAETKAEIEANRAELRAGAKAARDERKAGMEAAREARKANVEVAKAELRAEWQAKKLTE